MKLRLWFLPLLLTPLFLISATTTKVELLPAKKVEQVSPVLPSVGASVKKHKINFIERLLLKYAIRKIQNQEGDVEQANKQASKAYTFGFISMGFLLLGLFIPFVFIATIPTGIIALSAGNSALKEGTTERSKARTGRALGLAALITVGAMFLLALLLIAAFSGWN